MPYVLLIIALLLGLVLFVRWFVSARPADILQVVRWVAAFLGALLVLYIVLARRWALLPFLFFIVWPWLGRLKRGRTRAKNAAGPTLGQISDVETSYLAMSLDHDSGALTGKVLRGTFAGRRIEDLSIAELLVLRAECERDDTQSLDVIEAYLDRRHGTEWRDAAKMGDVAGGMSEEEALEILGLEAGAKVEEIEHAYRDMMQKVHPDRGGSDYLAAKINQARDILVAK